MGRGGLMNAATAAEILAFWFGRPGEPGYGQPRGEWFRKDEGFDAQIRSRFLPIVDTALRIASMSVSTAQRHSHRSTGPRE